MCDIVHTCAYIIHTVQRSHIDVCFYVQWGTSFDNNGCYSTSHLLWWWRSKIIANEYFYVFFAARAALTQFLPTLAHGEYCPPCANVETSIDSGAGVSAIWWQGCRSIGGCCVELEMEVVDCGCRRRLMADGARSEKSLARTLFLVFGGKTIGRSPLIP